MTHVMKPNPPQSSVVSHIETSHLIHAANQMTDFYMKCNTGLKWVKVTKRYLNLTEAGRLEAGKKVYVFF